MNKLWATRILNQSRRAWKWMHALLSFPLREFVLGSGLGVCRRDYHLWRACQLEAASRALEMAKKNTTFKRCIGYKCRERKKKELLCLIADTNIDLFIFPGQLAGW